MVMETDRGYDANGNTLGGWTGSEDDNPHDTGWNGTFRNKGQDNRDLGNSTSRPWDPEGQDYSYKDGRLVPGSRASDQDAARYQALGAQTGPAVRLNLGKANESRGLQLNALEMLRRQGSGEAPSSAAILSQRANQGGAHTMAAQAAGARGIGASITANQGATGALAPAMATANAQNAGERLGEVSKGQGSYAAGTLGAEGQDIGSATTNAQLQAQQRALEQQRQQYYEGLGFDTQNTQMVAAREAQNAREGRDRQHSADEMANRQKEEDAIKFGVSLLSDPRTKQNVTHMGSLSSLYHGRSR